VADSGLGRYDPAGAPTLSGGMSVTRSEVADGQSGCVRTVLAALYRLWLAGLALSLTVVAGDLQPVRWLRAHSALVVLPFAVLTVAMLAVEFALWALTRPARRPRR